jgi:hypothetical protein
MKKKIFQLAVIMSLACSSCYTNTMLVGNGAQTGVEVKAKNHYLIGGLAQLSTSDPQEMAKGASDYEVTIQHTFVDGLISAITFGIYTPNYHNSQKIGLSITRIG